MITSKENYPIVILSCFLAVFLKLARCEECDLSQIFRTPKDMSKVNFDHFELLERSNFDQPSDDVSTTTTTPQPFIPKTFANAQVMLRFGGDNIDGQNRIIRVPPQCRHLLRSTTEQFRIPHSNDADIHDLFYPYEHHASPCLRYYYPYPPPVPFAFPNYYYQCLYGLPPCLPKELRRYFSKGDDAEVLANKLERPSTTTESNEHPKAEMKPPEDEQTTTQITQSENREVIGTAKTKNARKKKTNRKKLCEQRNEKVETSSTKDPAKEKNHVESLLNKSLVPYRCKSCTDSKLLVTYPIGDKHVPQSITLDDIDEASSGSGKFPVDMDGFYPVPVNSLPSPPRTLDYRPNTYSQLVRPPMWTYPNHIVTEKHIAAPPPYETNTQYVTSTALSESSSLQQVNDLEPKISYHRCYARCGGEYYSNPEFVVYVQEPTQVETVNVKSIPSGKCFCRYSPLVEKDTTYYKAVPKYDIIPRKDLELVRVAPLTYREPSIIPTVVSGGTGDINEDEEQLYYWPKCRTRTSCRYCATCPKETRQLNEW